MIRPATLEDAPQLVSIAEEFIGGGDYLGPRRYFSPDAFGEHLAMALQSPLVGAFVAEREGRISAALFVMSAPDIFSGGSVALKLHWFAKPNRERVGLKMLKHAERWAADRGLTQVFFSAVSVAAGRLLERLGYQITEIVYNKAIPHGN